MKRKILSVLVLLFVAVSCEKKINMKEAGDLVPKTVIEDSTLPAINVGGVLLHSETVGIETDPMLVVLHGGPGADYRSNLNFKDLADDGLFVVFYDQRGSGLSQRLDEGGYPNVQVFIDELDGVINHYKSSEDQKVILAGHSWGGMLAAAYINQMPEKVDGLIVAEPGGFTWEQTKTYIAKTQKIELFNEGINDLVYQDQFLTGSDHNMLDYKMALSTAGDIKTGDTELIPYWRFGAVCNSTSISLAESNPDQMDFTTNLAAYATKVLFVYSEFNESYGVEHAKNVSKPLPNVELIEIKGCGHEIPEFGWDNYYPVIKEYLNEIL